MDWFIFIIIGMAWITSLFGLLERKTIIRTTIFAGISLLFGFGLLANGISFPTGYSIVTVGTTQTISQTFTNYTTATNPWVTGVGWTIAFAGFFFLIEVWTGMISLIGAGIASVRDKYGI